MDFRNRRWRSCLCWTVVLLSFFFVAVDKYGRDTAFRQQYMEEMQRIQRTVVCGQIYKKDYKNQSFQYYLKNCFVMVEGEYRPCNHIMSYFDSDDYSIGDTLKLQGKVKNFDAATNDGQFDARKFYFSQKIDFGIEAERVLGVHKTRIKLGEWLWELRQQLVTVFEKQMTKEQAGVLSSMLYGDKSLMNSEVKELYQSSGISHILAISGLHVSLIGMSLYRLLRKRGIGFIGSSVVSVPLVILYGQMTGWAISTERAVGMLILIFLSQILGRTNDLLNSLGIMVCVLLWDNPFLLAYAGFTFSVLAICGVGITGNLFSMKEFEKDLAKGKGETETKRSIGERLRQYKRDWKEGLWVSIGIWLTTLPLTAWVYYEVPIYAMLLNLLVLPVLSIIFVSGICGSFLGLGMGGLSFLSLRPAAILLDYYGLLCSGIGKFPATCVVVGRPSLGRIMAYYVFGGMGLLLVYRWKRCLLRMDQEMISGDEQREDRIKKYIGLTKVLMSILLILLIFSPPKWRNQIVFLDVGQGDGSYVETRDGLHIFIDGGSSDVKEVGKYRILPFLKSHGVSRIDYWFISHGDEDHLSGLLQVMEEGYPIQNLVLSKYMVRDEVYEKLIQSATTYNIPIVEMNAGDWICSRSNGKNEKNGLKIRCLYPNKMVFEDKNDQSLVLELTLGKKKGIFAGDISMEAEQKLVQEERVGKMDFYKVDHHGSKYSSGEEFLAKISPEISVISCGKKNRYGHPAKEAVERIEKNGSKIYYTMEQGQLTLEETGDKGFVMGIKEK